MTATRRDAIAMAGGILAAGVAAGAGRAAAAGPQPDWGSWVTHFDTTGQAASMAASFAPDNTALSLLFDKMEISLQGAGKPLAASIALAGHYPIKLPGEFTLSGVLLIARGIVVKSFDTSAALTLTIGESVRVLEWPRTSKQVDVGGGQNDKPVDLAEHQIEVTCFSGEQHLAMGDPPKWPPFPPLTLSVGMHARRSSEQQDVLFQLTSLDIALLDSFKSKPEPQPAPR